MKATSPASRCASSDDGRAGKWMAGSNAFGWYTTLRAPALRNSDTLKDFVVTRQSACRTASPNVGV